MKCYAAILTISLFLVGCQSREIPDYIQKCKRNDPKVAKCIKKSVEDLKPRLKSGIPELDVPPLDPFHIPEITVFRRNGDAARRATSFHVVLRDISVVGAGDFQITKLKLDVPNMTYRVGIKIPHLDLFGNYDVDARILVVPIKGTGDFLANATNIVGDAVIKGELVEKEGKKLMDFTEFTLKLKINDYYVHLDNLFEGDPVLSQAANQVLNANSKEYIEIATPVIEAKVAEILLDSAKKIVKNVEYDDAFPEN